MDVRLDITSTNMYSKPYLLIETQFMKYCTHVDVVKTNQDLTPKPLRVLGFEDIFDDNPVPEYSQLLSCVPLVVALKMVLETQLKVHFTMYDIDLHKAQIDLLFNTLYKQQRQRLSQFKRQGAPAILYNTNATLHFCFEAIKYCCDSLSFDGDIRPDREDVINIIKAYTLCNSTLVCKQTLQDNIYNTYLCLDLAASEFKFHKDIKAAIYKASLFFQFCESSPNYKQYLDAFCVDYKVRDWKEYISRLVNLFADTIDRILIQVDNSDKSSIDFFDQFVINRQDIVSMAVWSKEALLYFRNHFLVKFAHNIYLVISPDLISDRIYQGLKFALYDSVIRHKLLRQDGKPYKDLPDFTKHVGEDFSETHLVYELLRRPMKEKVDVLLTGVELKQQGFKEGEPDLYIRKGDSLLLIEVKDLILCDDVKNSTDKETIIKAINKRICSYPDKPHKGFGQIIDNIDRLVGGQFESYDSGSSIVTYIYPIIIATDNAFSAIGINALIVRNAQEIFKDIGRRFGSRFIAMPIILDIDTLINLNYRLAIGEIDLFDMLKDYVCHSRSGLIPLKIYVYEKYFKGKDMSDEENMYLFGNFF